MKTYKLGEEAFRQSRRRLITFFIVIGFIACGYGLLALIPKLTEYGSVGLYSALSFFGDNPETIFAIVVTAAIFMFAVWRVTKQQLEVLKSVKIELGTDYIARQQVRIPKVVLKRDEISILEDIGGVLCVRTANKYRSLAIPKTLEGYEDVERELLSWRIPLKPKQTRAKWINWVSGLAALVGLGVLFFIFDFWLVLIAWIGLLSLYGYIYFVLSRSEGVDPRYRRNYLFLIGWIVLMGILKFGLILAIK